MKTKRKHQRNTLPETCKIVNYIQRRERFKKEIRQMMDKIAKNAVSNPLLASSILSGNNKGYANLLEPVKFLFSDNKVLEGKLGTTHNYIKLPWEEGENK